VQWVGGQGGTENTFDYFIYRATNSYTDDCAPYPSGFHIARDPETGAHHAAILASGHRRCAANSSAGSHGNNSTSHSHSYTGVAFPYAHTEAGHLRGGIRGYVERHCPAIWGECGRTGEDEPYHEPRPDTDRSKVDHSATVARQLAVSET